MHNLYIKMLLMVIFDIVLNNILSYNINLHKIERNNCYKRYLRKYVRISVDKCRY